MYAVIFRAEVNAVTSAYLDTAKRLRDLAFADYGCIDFISSFEDGVEIAISYWKDEASIKAWKQNIEHLAGQQLGRETWYKSYRVQVAHVTRDYQFPAGKTNTDIPATEPHTPE